MATVIDDFLEKVQLEYNANLKTITLGVDINQLVADLLEYAQQGNMPLIQANVVSTSTQVTITGNGFFDNLGGEENGQQHVILIADLINGGLGLTLTATPLQTVNLKQIFSDLAGTTQAEGMYLENNDSLFYQLDYETPQWLLTDITPEEGVVYPSIGLNFSADINLNNQFTHIVNLTGITTVRLAGPVSFPRGGDTQLYLDAVIAGFSMALGTMKMNDFHLLIRTVYYSDDASQNFTGTIFTGVLEISESVTARIGVDTQLTSSSDPSASIWAFFSDFNKPLTLSDGLSALSGFVGGNASNFDMPDSVRVLGDFGLTSVNVGVNPFDPTDIEFVFLEVGSDKVWDPPIPYVTVEDLFVQWQIQRPFNNLTRSQSGGVGGSLVFGKTNPVHLDVVALIPEYIINANLRDGDQISVVDALSEWFPDAGNLSQDLIIDDLQIVANFDTKVYEFEGSIRPVPAFTLNLIITELTLDRVTLSTNYRQDKLYGTVMAELQLFNAPWVVSASYLPPLDTGSGNWSFLVQLASGNVVALSDLVAQFLNFNPADIPAVNMTELYFKYNLSDSTYDFKGAVAGSWTLDIIPGKPALNVTAAVAVSSFVENQQTKYKGEIDGTLAINSLNVGVGYAFDPTNTNYSFIIAYKKLALYATLSRTTKKIDNVNTTVSILKVNLGDLSVGDIIEYLVNLANPYSTFQLTTPWDILNSLNFKNLQLVVDLTNNTVGVEYRFDLELLFIYIESIGITYIKRSDGKSGVVVSIKGRFLDISFGDEAGEDDLTWDLLNDPAPAVPGRGNQLFDLKYLGLGQHISMTDSASFESVADVIDALELNMLPVVNDNENPLSQPAQHGLVFDQDSHWLFGTRFTILGGIDFSAVFNDPYLYGLLLELSGDVSGSLSGLKFELLYKRITDNLGVYKVVLRVPEAFRQLEFGEVSVTLPVIKVDIYTNGNFKVDLGFPTSDDFTESFGLQVFPFIGKGGIYFGYLVGVASKSVPKITNGEFSPVIELGLALAIGVGKEINKGPLRAGLSLTVQAILEGSLAWFHAYNDDKEVAQYYWVRGTAAIVGKLYGAVDFKVIKVSVSVTAKASVTLTIEAHMPSDVYLTVEVSVKASVKVLFVRIHFSFNLDLDLSFTIGSHSYAPWVVNPDAPLPHSTQSTLRQNHALPLGRKQSLHKRAIHSLNRLQWHTPLNRIPAKHLSCDMNKAIKGRLREHHIETSVMSFLAVTKYLVSPTPSLNWEPVSVFNEIQPIPVLVLPMLSVAQNSDLLPEDRGEGDVSNQVVLTFMVENGIHPDAKNLNAQSLQSADHAHSTNSTESLPFNLLIEGMLAWSITAMMNDSTVLSGNIDRGELQTLNMILNNTDIEGDGFSIAQLQQFLDKNYLFSIGSFTADTAHVSSTSGTFIPVLPPLTLIQTGRPDIDFSSYREVGNKYEDAVAEYFSQMEINYGVDNAVDPFSLLTVTPSSNSPESLAQMVQRDYFMMVARNGAQTALDLMDSLPMPVLAVDSLASIADEYSRIEMQHTVVAGETVVTLMETYDMTLTQLKDVNPSMNFDIPLLPGVIIMVLEGPTVNSIVDANRHLSGLLKSGSILRIDGANIQAEKEISLNDIASNMGVSLFNLVSNNTQSKKLLAQNYEFILPAFTYQSVINDTLNFVAAWLLVRNGEIPAVESQQWFSLDFFAWYEQAIAALNYEGNDYVDFSKEISVGTTILVPPVYLQSDSSQALTYISRDGDTLKQIAGYFSLMQNPTLGFTQFRDQLSVTGSPTFEAVLPVGSEIGVPQWQHRIQNIDSFSLFTASLGLEIDQIMSSPSLSESDLLQALAVVSLPLVEYTIPDAQQTFATVASTFNMDLDALAQSIAPQTGYFNESIIKVPNVATLPVSDLLLLVKQYTNEAASTCSRFMLHGLRLPLPPEDPNTAPNMESLYGMYEMIGQQISIDQFTLPYTFSFTSQDTVSDPISPSGIKLFNTYLVQEGDTLASLLVQYPNLLEYNPGLVAADIKAGLLLFVTLVDELSITIDQTFLDANKASPNLNLQWQNPVSALPLSESNPVRHSLTQPIHWQSPTTPPWAGQVSNDNASPGEPTLWLFPNKLLTNISKPVWAANNYQLLLGDVDDSGVMITSPLDYYDWATVVDVAIQKVPDTPEPIDVSQSVSQSPQGNTSGFLSHTYQLLAGGNGTQQTLLSLWQYIIDNPAEEAAQVALLITPSNQSDNPSGFESQTLDPNKTFVIKGNLSTLSTSGGSGAVTAKETSLLRDVNGAPVAASIDNVGQFLQMLWEASVVGSGGYFLNYIAADQGLPADIFDNNNIANLRVLVILPSQSAQVNPVRSFYNFNNCAVMGDNITLDSANVFVERIDGSETITASTVPAGVYAFEGSLLNPGTTQLAIGADEWRTKTLYSMLGYSIEGGGQFIQSNDALPVGPAVPPENQQQFKQSADDDDYPWYYQQSIPAYEFVTHYSLSQAPHLPLAHQNPYAGIAPNAKLAVDFSMHDIYGNVLTPQNSIDNLSLDIGYTDDLIAVSQWPGTTSSYVFTADPSPVNNANVRLTLALQVANYVIGAGSSYAVAHSCVSAHKLKYSQIYYQIEQAGVSLSLINSIKANPDSSDGSFALNVTIARQYIQSVYTFLSAAANIIQASAIVLDTTTSLNRLTSTYPVTVSELGSVNQYNNLVTLFADVQIPAYTVFPQQGTLASVAVKAGLTAANIASQNTTVALNVGVQLITPLRQFDTEAHQTLLEIATRAYTSVENIGISNASTNGILTEGATVAVDGVTLTVQNNENLNDLVTRFAAEDVMTNPQTICASNEAVKSLIVDSSQLNTNVYVVQAGDNFAKIVTMFTHWSVDQLGTDSQSVRNIFVQGASLYLGVGTSIIPLTGGSFASYASTYNLTVEQLAEANKDKILINGASVLLPNMAAIDSGSGTISVPYSIPLGESWNHITSNLGLNDADAVAMMTANQYTPNVLNANITITIGTDSTTTGSDSTFSTVLAALNENGAQYGYADLSLVIKDVQNLMSEWGCLAVAMPLIPASKSWNDTAAYFNVKPDSLAVANAAMQHLIQAGQLISIDGVDVSTVSGDTFASIVARFQVEKNITISIEQIIASIGNESAFLISGSPVILPPKTTHLDAILYSSMPDPITYPSSVFEINTQVIFARQSDELHPDFSPGSAVQQVTSSIAPQLGVDNTGSYRATGFALTTETIFNGLKVAVGHDMGSQSASHLPHLFAVNFASNGFSQVSITPQAPAVFAVKPIVNKEVSVSNVAVSPLNNDATLGVAVQKDFKSVDLDLYAQDLMGAIEWILSAGAAIPSYELNSTAYENIMATKSLLANTISQGLAAVLEGTDSSGLPNAQERLRQSLMTNLNDGFAVNAVLQYPTMAHSLASTRANLSGKPVSVLKSKSPGETDGVFTLVLTATSSFESIESFFGVDLADIVEQLSIVTPLLKVGATLYYPDHEAFVVPDESTTLNDVAQFFGLSDATQVAQYNRQIPGLFVANTEISITMPVPDFTISSGKVSLDSELGYVNFLLTVPQEKHHKALLMNLDYQINELEYDITPVQGSGGFSSSQWLSFVIPITNLNKPAAVGTTMLGQADIPMVLRAVPESPIFKNQSFDVGVKDLPSEFPDNLLAAKRWVYHLEFEQNVAAQDSSFIMVNVNQLAVDTQSELLSPELMNLFRDFAQFNTVYASLQNILLDLLDPAAVLLKQPVLINALNTFDSLVANIAQSWSAYWTHTNNTALGRVGGVEEERSFEVIQVVDPLVMPITLRSLILTSKNNNDGYPYEQYPDIGIWDNETLTYLPLIKLPVAQENPTEVVYNYPDNIKAFMLSRYRYGFNDLDAVDQQNIWAQMVVKRNLELLPARAAEDEFVYQTPVVSFLKALYPAMVREDIINTRTNATETLSQALTSIFDNLLGNTPDGFYVKTTVRYGYTLAVPSEASSNTVLTDQAITSELPVLYWPKRLYDANYQTTLLTSIDTWFSHHSPSQNNAAYIFEVTVYSNLNPNLAQPVLVLDRVAFPI
ncbi:hypothetical protein ACU6U9_22440 [Pseudomonas sp. HK3]